MSGWVVICHGPPRCPIGTDEARTSPVIGGCVWCRRIYREDDGTETESGPADDRWGKPHPQPDRGADV